MVNPFVRIKMSNPIILVITALVFCIGSDAGRADLKGAEMAGEGGWGQLAAAGEDVQVTGEIVKEWFEAYLANDLDRAKEMYVPSRREKAEHNLEQMKKLLEVVPGWRFRPMVIMVAGWEAKVISGVINVSEPGAGAASVLIVHLKKEEAKWGILHWSADAIRQVPGFYPQFQRKYPGALIWFDETVDDWLKPQKEAQIDINIEELFQTASAPKTNDTLARKLRGARGEQSIFESYFPDSDLGGEILDSWYKAKDKESYSAQEIITIIRNGFRRSSDGRQRQYKEDLIRWVGQHYIWPKEQKNKKAVELVYYASFDSDINLVATAVYYGLSVAGNEQDERVLKRLVDICMSDINTGRILWGTQGKHDKMLSYLRPYLDDSDEEIRARAAIVQKALKGEIDYAEWQREQFKRQRQAEFGDKMDTVREVLLKGNSRQRRDMFAQIRQYSLGVLFDDSFVEPLKTCLKDSDPVVKEMTLGLGRELLCRVDGQDGNMMEFMAQLAQDSDSKVRKQVAILVGSCWFEGTKKQNDKAIEIILQLSKDKNPQVRDAAVYYGLSGIDNKSDEVIKRLVDMIAESDGQADLDQIIQGLRIGTDKEKVRAYLKPLIGLRNKKGELARKAYFEIFKAELETEAVIF
jgi:hypothetical protein